MATPRKDPRNPIRELEDTRSYKFRQILTCEWLEPRWRQQIPLCEIAQEAGCSISTIRRYVRWFKLPPRPARKGEQGWGAVLTAEYLEAAYVEDAMTVEAIAAEVGTSGSTVVRWLAANDIPRRGHRPGVDNLLYEELLTAESLARRLEERASLTDIAREAGCTITAVRAALRRHGLEERAANVRPPQPPCAGPEQLRSLYESGLSLEAIGIRLGVSRTKVRSDLSRFGIRPYARPGFRLTDGAWGSGQRARAVWPTRHRRTRRLGPALPGGCVQIRVRRIFNRSRGGGKPCPRPTAGSWSCWPTMQWRTGRDGPSPRCRESWVSRAGRWSELRSSDWRASGWRSAMATPRERTGCQSPRRVRPGSCSSGRRVWPRADRRRPPGLGAGCHTPGPGGAVLASVTGQR